jgi:uncharacterized LabA/DUF88 family protein
MPANPEARSLAVFCDFENVALGVREAKYAQFDMQKVLERPARQGLDRGEEGLLRLGALQGFQGGDARRLVRADRDPARAPVGQELADIRMVVDALDLCYTKAHVDTFVIVSGDSDFSPLVSKLRENAKT